MPVLGVCGDSFMAATVSRDEHISTKDSEGKHFTEILAKKIGYDYFTLARGACSNTAIRLQIDEMIKRKVDLVIIGTTSPNRLDIPHPNKEFDTSIGVYNLDYSTEIYPDTSTLNENFKHNFISETLTNIFFDPQPFFKKIFNVHCRNNIPNLDDKQLLALEYFIDHLYDHSYKTLQDSWVIHSGLCALEKAQIPYICVWNLPGMVGIDFTNDHRLIVSHPELSPTEWEYGTRRWHTTDRAQEIGAKKWYEYLLKHGYICSQST